VTAEYTSLEMYAEHNNSVVFTFFVYYLRNLRLTEAHWIKCLLHFSLHLLAEKCFAPINTQPVMLEVSVIFV
jgi:hypothetical protein